MNPLKLPARLYSDAIWTRLFEHSTFPLLEKKQEVLTRLASLDRLRDLADYNTGSISAASAWALFALSRHFKPRLVVEVGTFIGRSALAIALAQMDHGEGCLIHTCDKSNAIDLPPVERSRVKVHHKTTSTEMLTGLLQEGLVGQVEMVHLDGKLVPEDPALIHQLCSAVVTIWSTHPHRMRPSVFVMIPIGNR